MKVFNTLQIRKKIQKPGFIIALVIITGFIYALNTPLRFFHEEASNSTSLIDTIKAGKTKPFDSLYQATIIKAQGLLNSAKYEQALQEFQKALKMKPEDRSIADQIDKVNKLLTQQKANEQDYQKYLGSGDTYFKAKDYLNAKSAYQQAIDLKPGDQLAKDKLKQTMDLLRSQKAQNMLYDIAIAGAEKLYQAKEYEKAKSEYEKASKMLPDDKYAKERINEIIRIMVAKQEKDELYSKAVAAGDKFFGLKNWQGSLLQFQSASLIKPDEKYPKDKIAELTVLIKTQKEQEEAYKKAIAAADNLFQGNSYNDSKKEYQNALSIKPLESYPASRIKQIDEILSGKLRADQEYDRLVSAGDSLYIDKKFIGAKANYQQALKIKPGESYPKEMIAKVENAMVNQEAGQKAIDEAYQAAISAADKLLSEKSYDRAKTEYQNALSIKPAEKYPSDKINEIAAIIAGMDKQKSLDDQFNSLIAGAEKLFTDKNYTVSKAEFDKASQLKPEEKYPRDKIIEINKIIAEQTQAKSRGDQYSKHLEQADHFYDIKSYEQSKFQYQLALQIKPGEEYPAGKIAELDKIIAGLAAQKAIDDQYKNIVFNADKLLNAKSYSEAKSEYEKALTVKQNEDYPKKRIDEINRYYAGLAAEKEKEEKFKSIIAKADQFFIEKSYEPSRSQYSEAQLIKPNDQYTKGRIAEIDRILADLNRQKSLDDQYTNLLAEGDAKLAGKSYPEAKVKYQSALVLKPDQTYPKDKIKEIDQALADLSKTQALELQYQTAITQADKLLAAKSYDQAKVQYNTALSLKPDEGYPKEKVAMIDDILADIAKQKALDDQYKGIVLEADKLFTAKSFSGEQVCRITLRNLNIIKDTIIITNKQI
ncbi:MAG: hypothetical protein WCL00_08025, partial [Bacteroidota bacterium]